MGSFRRARPFVVALLVFVLLTAAGWLPARAQFGGFGLPELSKSVLDRAGSSTRTHLEQLKQYIANRQWQEAIAVLRQVSDAEGDKMIAVDEHLAISIRQYCQRRLVTLPPEALAIYRDQVDAKARRWYEAGLRDRDPSRLERVVEEYFASRYGDDALTALAEIALESGHYDEARSRWQQLLPPESSDSPPLKRLYYPDPDMPPEAIEARLVLVSILQGNLQRAETELAHYRTKFPEASGRLAGRDGLYAETLARLLKAASDWSLPAGLGNWLTFAGRPDRNHCAPQAIDVGAPVWRVKLPPAPPSDATMARRAGLPLMRVAEKHRQPLSYHPLVVDDKVLINTLYEVYAFDLKSGKRLWSVQSSMIRPHRDPRLDVSRNVLGTPRFTMTAFHGRLFANLGPPGSNSLPPPGNELICIDLAAEGRLIWKVAVEEESLTLEGAPVCDGRRVYVAARKYDISSVSAYVICFDAQTGRQVWKRYLCAANSPGGGLYNEITHNLLTLHYGTLYCNTNLGAVAAVSTRDGRVRWIATYDRVARRTVGEDYHHFYRDLTPCVYANGRVFVAPSDTGYIFAFDAASGTVLWTTAPGAANSIVHLLGVRKGNLLASGKSLWWIDAQSGKVRRRFAEQGSMQAWGRGVLAGDYVYWPTRSKIYVATQATPPAERPIVRVIDLATRRDGATGGNLIPAGDFLLVAGYDTLDAYSQYSRLQGNDEAELTQNVSPPRALPEESLVATNPTGMLVRRLPTARRIGPEPLQDQTKPARNDFQLPPADSGVSRGSIGETPRSIAKTFLRENAR